MARQETMRWQQSKKKKWLRQRIVHFYYRGENLSITPVGFAYKFREEGSLVIISLD